MNPISPTQMEQVSTRALTAALDVAQMRHQIIATNVANANTPGYVPQKLSFSTEWKAAQQRFQVDARLAPTDPAPGIRGGVQLDAEMAAMAQNNLHQQVLLKVLQRHLGLMATAISEGKR